jgi:hypothetical protein
LFGALALTAGVRLNGRMISTVTLYKTPNPEEQAFAEFYQLTVSSSTHLWQPPLFAQEQHGWWEGGQLRTEELRTTFKPEEAFASGAEAQDWFRAQMKLRATDGFKFAVSPNPFDLSQPIREVIE